MFTIKGKQKYGGVYANGSYIAFMNGVGTTDDAEVAAILKADGYIVEGSAEVADPLAAMSVNKLKAYATENGVDLQGATKKEAILALIREAANDDLDDESDDEDFDDEESEDSEDEEGGTDE